MDGEDLKQQWVNLILKNICKWDVVLSPRRIEHNGANIILNEYYISEMNYFKFYYYIK
jgi:hypothetical protein